MAPGSPQAQSCDGGEAVGRWAVGGRAGSVDEGVRESGVSFWPHHDLVGDPGPLPPGSDFPFPIFKRRALDRLS